MSIEGLPGLTDLPGLPGLIDAHCHLNYDYSPKTVETLVNEARAQGIEAMVTIGTEMATIAQVQEISERFPEVFHTLGVHPHEAITWQEGDYEKLKKAAAHPKCRAIGEIGLDYHYDHSPKEVQRQRLEEQLNLAAELKKPVVIHSREAEEDLLQLLTAYTKRISNGHIPGHIPGRIPGMIHCFSGTPSFGQACLDLGFFISFSGIITFKNAESLRECARRFPLDRILVETDSPYLAPIPYRGKKCEPSMVRLTATKLAEVRGISITEVAQATTANAKRFFGI